MNDDFSLIIERCQTCSILMPGRYTYAPPCPMRVKQIRRIAN